MKNKFPVNVSTRVWLMMGLCFVAVGSIFTFMNFSSSDTHGPASDNPLASLAPPSFPPPPANNGRPLELNDAINKTKKTESEAKVVLNDPALNEAWGIKKSDAARAWEVSKGSRDVVVAIIDTGADINHEDLKRNIWSNPGETGLDANGKDKATNGLDDDGNGFKDDVHGWNFITNNNDLTDNHGHGTHIAGIVGAEAGNKKGIAGISPDVSLMILKYYDPKFPHADNLKNTIQAIKYAVKMKAQIINYSGGGTDFSKDEHDAVDLARQQNILFVAAAGNERSNSDKFKYYPADYGLSNIISVTAIDPKTEVLPSSNYGTETVDIAAPGQKILSTLPGNSYGEMTGTSQATAFVTGAAVLVMAHKKNYIPEEVKKFIISTGQSEGSLIAKTKTNRVLNLYKALTILDSSTSPTGVTVSVPVNDSFTTEANTRTGSGGAMSDFGKSLMQKVERTANGQKQ